MKIAVTAASGRLGHAILKVLSEELGPDNVVGIARSPEKIAVPDIENAGVTITPSKISLQRSTASTRRS